jgi:diguanylate cyclase (GGDEF)-like protein/PAS domain S-box-containing protein
MTGEFESAAVVAVHDAGADPSAEHPAGAAAALNEAERLLALHRLMLLDTPPTASFDAVARLAQAALHLPILCVSLVDQNRVWFKSRIGLAVRETARQGSFCDHVVGSRQMLLVRDAAADPRFANHALVTGAHHVRSYLGIPLYTRERQLVGTLCAMDVESREFGETEIVVLSEFAKIAEELLSCKELAAKSDSVLQYAMEREKLFRETFEQAAVGMVHTSLHGLILRINQRACALLGYTPAELRELSIPSITHPEDLPHNIREFKRTLDGEIEGYRLEQRLLCKDGRYLWVALSVAIKRSLPRQPDYGVVVIEDISAQKQAESDAVKQREALQQQVAAQQHEIQQHTEALRETQESLRETQESLRETQESLHETQQSLHETQQSLRDTQESLNETQDALRAAQDAARAAHDQQREAQAALQAANAKLAAESATDSLTLLPNRRSFNRRSEQAASALRQARKSYGLVLMDLDNFKQINDEYGHDVGDEVLRLAGIVLSSQLRNSSDMAARLGGDEFAVLCFGDINEPALHDVAERIHTQLGKESIATPKGLLRFSGSFGLALSLADDPDWKTVYGRADAALREAKSAGKDRISFGRSSSKNATVRLRALSAAVAQVKQAPAAGD